MSNVPSSSSNLKRERSLQEIFEPSTRKQSNLSEWWYRFTAPPAAPPNATFIQKDAERRSRFLSAIAFFLILIFALLIGATLNTPNPMVSRVDSILFCICCSSLIFNRVGKRLVAAIILVGVVETALVVSILLLAPIANSTLPVFDLFVFVELLAVSLLPTRSVFLVAFINSIFITLAIKFLPHVQLSDAFLTGSYYNAIILPITLQIITAGVTYLWVRSSILATARADRAEVIAKLEHKIASQKDAIEEQKQLLENGIQQLIAAQAKAINENFDDRISLPEAKELWPLAGSLNTLLGRLHRSYQAETQLQRVNQAIQYLDDELHNAEFAQRPIQAVRTGTAIDQLMIILNKKVIVRSPSHIE